MAEQIEDGEMQNNFKYLADCTMYALEVVEQIDNIIDALVDASDSMSKYGFLRGCKEPRLFEPWPDEETDQ